MQTLAVLVIADCRNRKSSSWIGCGRVAVVHLHLRGHPLELHVVSAAPLQGIVMPSNRSAGRAPGRGVRGRSSLH
jgi:hypothetical protein